MISATHRNSSAQMAAPTHSALLWHKIELARPLLHASSVRFWTHPELPRLLPFFLSELHQIIRGGLAVMRLALHRSQELAPADPLAAALSKYLARHIEEEKDHDVWLLEDMVASGMNTQALLSRLVSAPVAALLGAQALWVLQEHPIAFLGYVAVVEGDPPCNEHLDIIREQTGYPEAAFRCLREHSEADVGHLLELRSALDAMPLGPRHHELLGQSAFETVHALARVFNELSTKVFAGCE